MHIWTSMLAIGVVCYKKCVHYNQIKCGYVPGNHKYLLKPEAIEWISALVQTSLLVSSHII